ncbi:MAG: hypothetical protein Q9205_007210 [Flavoplaca limonia]
MIAQDTLINPQLKRIKQRRDQRIYVRIYPSYTTLDGSEQTYLLVHCSSQQPKSDQTTLATYGLFLERTDYTHAPGQNASEGSLVNKFKSVPSKTYEEPQNFQMPTRTIEVGPADGSRLPRLICHEAGATGQWVTLSYCWGGSVPLKTTKKTIFQWQEGIPFDQLPLTFQHAVEITRRLGFEHLWIDSLCIIQDSFEDWSREAPRMNGIYRSGVLNIAADTARTCHDGIFTIRSEPLVPLRLPLNSQKHSVRSSMYVRSGDHNEGWDIILGSASSLSSRAWVFQESVLSPRTLRYGKRQLFWECSQCILGEMSVAPLIDASKIRGLADAYKTSLKMLLPAGLTQPLIGKDAPRGKTRSRVGLYNLWLLVMTKYTQRKLTYSSDKLAALAGVASFFETRIGDRYLAGLFEGDILRSLLWRVMDPTQAAAINPALAPSWSWASVTGAVELEVPFTASIVTPQAVGNLTASVGRADLYLHDGSNAPAQHLTGISRAMLEIEGYLLLPTAKTKIGYDRDRLNEIILRIHDQTRNKVIMSGISLHCDIGKDTDDLTDVCLLHLGAWKWTFGLSKRSTRLEIVLVGLLLRPPDSSSTAYRRVGIATTKISLQLKNLDDVYFIEDMEKTISKTWDKTVVTII